MAGKTKNNIKKRLKFSKFLNNKEKVVVIGSNGYIGKNLVSFLKKKDFKVYEIDKSKNINHDLLSENLAKYIPKNSIVVHLAGISQDYLCRINPFRAYEQNVIGTFNLLKICQKKKIKKFILASSEWVYPSYNYNKIQKDQQKILINQITSVYAKTKLICENMLNDCLSIKSKIILRFGIVYGNKKNNLSVLESLYFAVKNGKNIIIGSKNTARRFIHINDICNGIEKSFSLNKDTTLNLTGKKLISLNDILKQLSKIFKKNIKFKEKDPNNPNIRNVKSSKFFNVKKYIDLKKGLREL